MNIVESTTRVASRARARVAPRRVARGRIAIAITLAHQLGFYLKYTHRNETLTLRDTSSRAFDAPLHTSTTSVYTQLIVVVIGVISVE